MFFIPLFLSNLSTKKIGRKIEYVRTTDSTNKEIYSRLQNNEAQSGNVLLSDEQTDGKGRRGSSWFSSAGKSLTLSFLLENNHDILIKKLPLISGLAIIKAIKQIARIDCQLKWPNDVVYNSKKLAGILIEQKDQHFIIGIGINVNEIEFPESIQNTTCSLSSILNYSIQREPLLAFILNHFENLLNDDMDNIIKQWESSCNHMDSIVKFHSSNEIINAHFIGLNNNGSAKIKVDKKEMTANSGIIE